MSVISKQIAIKREARNLFFSSFGKVFFLTALLLISFCGVSAVIQAADVLLYRVFSYNVYISLMIVLKTVFSLIFSPFWVGVFRCYGVVSLDVDSVFSEVVRDYLSLVAFCKSLGRVFIFLFIISSAIMLPHMLKYSIEFLLDSFGVLASYTVVRIAKNAVLLIVCAVAVVFACGVVCMFHFNESRPFLSAKRSFIIMKRHKLEFFCFCVSFTPLFLLSFISFGILYLFIIPYFLISVNCFINYVMSENIAPKVCDFS